MQVIVYKEFLPVLLGPSIIQTHGLHFDPRGMKRTVYKATLNPGMLSEFSAVAFRFGHTLVQNFYKMINPKTQEIVGSYDIKDQYFNSEKVCTYNGKATYSGTVETRCNVHAYNV